MSLTHLQTIELGSSQSSITFSSIPQDYDDLVLLTSLRSDRAADEDPIAIDINGTQVGMSSTVLRGSGTGASSNNSIRFNVDTANNATANTFGSTTCYISNYTKSQAKSLSIDTVSENNAATAFQSIRALVWDNTNAITSISLSPVLGTNFLANSTFYLYGVTAGGDGTVSTA